MQAYAAVSDIPILDSCQLIRSFWLVPEGRNRSISTYHRNSCDSTRACHFPELSLSQHRGYHNHASCYISAGMNDVVDKLDGFAVLLQDRVRPTRRKFASWHQASVSRMSGSELLMMRPNALG